MENVPISPSRERSSGTKPTPALRTSLTLRPTSSSPSRVIEPWTRSCRPRMASVSSVWPLPWTPAMARISPRAIPKLMPSTTCWPLGAMTVRSLTSKVVSWGLGGSLVQGQAHGAAHHHGRQLGGGGAGIGRAHHLAAPDDGDGVRDGLHLTELVGNEDDGGAVALELAHDVQQLIGILRSQHGRGLIEDEHLGVADECLDDFHALLHAHGEVFDQRVGVDVESVPVGDLPDLPAGVIQVQESAGLGGLRSQCHILRDSKDRDQHEVLVHHADAGRHGVAGAAEGDRFVVDQDFALCGLVQSVEDVHQRGLASAVLAEQTVNLPGFDDHIDVIVGYQGAEAFCNALEFKFQNSDQSRDVRKA